MDLDLLIMDEMTEPGSVLDLLEWSSDNLDVGKLYKDESISLPLVREKITATKC